MSCVFNYNVQLLAYILKEFNEDCVASCYPKELVKSSRVMFFGYPRHVSIMQCAAAENVQ